MPATLLELLTQRAQASPSSVIFEYKETYVIAENDLQFNAQIKARPEDVLWHQVTGTQLLLQVEKVAAALRQKGVRSGDLVMILARSTYYAVLVEFATYRLGAAVMPVYETSSSEQIARILDATPAKCIYVPSAKYAHNVPESAKQIRDDELRHTIMGQSTGTLADAGTVGQNGISADTGVAAPGQSAGSVLEKAPQPDTLAALMHTVNAKGEHISVRYTHADFMRNIVTAQQFIEAGGTDTRRYLSFLSLAHIAPKIFMYIALASGSVVGVTPGVRSILSDLQHFSPSYMMSVPRVYDRIYTDLVDSAPLSIFGAFFRRALKRAFEAEPDHAFVKKVRTLLGGNLSATFTTSIKPDPHLMQFFENVGVGAYDFYTVTESGGLIAMSAPKSNKPGHAGQVLQGNNVFLDAGGQLIVNDVQTGDIGEVDAQGFLSIKGREKEVLTVSSGQNVLPEPLQQSLATDPIIAEALVIGESRPYITALLALDETHVSKVLDENRVDEGSVEAAILLDKLVQKAVDTTNKTVSRGEQIRQYAILEEGFGKFSDLYTGSLRLKRNAACKHYKDLINEVLYARA